MCVASKINCRQRAQHLGCYQGQYHLGATFFCALNDELLQKFRKIYCHKFNNHQDNTKSKKLPNFNICFKAKNILILFPSNFVNRQISLN